MICSLSLEIEGQHKFVRLNGIKCSEFKLMTWSVFLEAKATIFFKKEVGERGRGS